MIKKLLFQAIRTLPIIAIISHTHTQAKGTKEIDFMDMPGVFNNIRMNQAPDLHKHLKKIPGFSKTPVQRFFDVLHPSSKFEKLTKRQMAYHLVTLTALGQKVHSLLIEGEYNTPLTEDLRSKQSFFERHGIDDPFAPTTPDNLYNFFGNAKNAKVRQRIWDAMRKSGFVDSQVVNVRTQGYYNSNLALKKLLESSKKTINIMIGCNSIPTYYGALAYPRPCKPENPARNSFPYSNFKKTHPMSITVGIDHRHRPRVLGNAFNKTLWSNLPVKKIGIIGYDPHFYWFVDQIKAAIPKNLHHKIKIVDTDQDK